MSLCALAGAVLLFLVNWQHSTAAQADLVERKQLNRPQAPTPTDTPKLLHISLPPFNSAVLVEAVNDAAEDSGLILNEVSYVLEDSKNQPFLRYRVVLSVVASYPEVRQFVERLTNRVPHLTLDGFECSRSGTSVLVPTCDLALSGLYGKGTGERG